MRILFIDSTAIAETGPGSPAYFSRYLLRWLAQQQHEAVVTPRFDAQLAATFDAVVCEWCNEEAFEAAQSGACKRLIIRMRGYDVWSPLGSLAWENVDALVYESKFLKELAEEQCPALAGFNTHVLPGGVDLANIPFRVRTGDKIVPMVALVARATSDKGFQLALEWARQYDEVYLHIACAFGESNPRLLRYLEHAKPDNVKLYGAVDTIAWLDKINADFLLSTSIWETLGYTIVEAMAMGIKPLIHAAPGAVSQWGWDLCWEDFEQLKHTIGDGYDSREYRDFVERNFDAEKLSAAFVELVQSIEPRTPRIPDLSLDLLHADEAFRVGRLDVADQLISRFRQRAPVQLADDRAGAAWRLAVAYYNEGKLDEATVWTLRSLADGPRRHAFALLAEIESARGRSEEALRWAEAAASIPIVPSRYAQGPSDDQLKARVPELRRATHGAVGLGEWPERYLVVVPCRNAGKWIGRCVESVMLNAATDISVNGRTVVALVVIDDASTDDTCAVAQRLVDPGKFESVAITRNERRRGSLCNIHDAIHIHGRPGDVVVILDGDDWLYGDVVFGHLAQAYRYSDAWLTYGNFIVHPTNAPSWMPPYPVEVARTSAFRSYPWRVSHPKTFRYELFRHINLADLQHEGQWFMTAGDVALMMPMLEMAGKHAVYIEKPLYVYNMETDQQDHKLDPDGQVRARDLILAKKPYERLRSL